MLPNRYILVGKKEDRRKSLQTKDVVFIVYLFIFKVLCYLHRYTIVGNHSTLLLIIIMVIVNVCLKVI